MFVKNRAKIAGLLVLITVLCAFCGAHMWYMWNQASSLSSDSSTAMGSFVRASEWLSKNLKENEIAIVPDPELFTVLNPELNGRLLDYGTIWSMAGVEFGERADPAQMQKLCTYFMHLLESNSSIRYIVEDWVNDYDVDLFEALAKGGETPLSKVEVFPFTLSTGWSNEITVYEWIPYTPLLSMGLFQPPQEYSVLPSNTSVSFDSNGVTLQKLGSRMGFYLPFEYSREINASKRNYMSLQLNLGVENTDLTVVFYYDKNRDGVWSGYGVDYVNSVSFDQAQQGWIKGVSYTIAVVIPQAEDPVCQIGLIFSGGDTGAITFSNLTIYTANQS